MSRSASLTINLVLDVFDINNIAVGEDFSERMKVVDLSQVRQRRGCGPPQRPQIGTPRARCPARSKSPPALRLSRRTTSDRPAATSTRL